MQNNNSDNNSSEVFGFLILVLGTLIPLILYIASLLEHQSFNVNFMLSYLKYIKKFYLLGHETSFSLIFYDLILPIPRKLGHSIGYSLVISLFLCSLLKRIFKQKKRNNDEEKIIIADDTPRIAQYRDLKKFENPTIMAKNGIVLGIMDTGLISHQFLIKGAFKKNANAENFGKLRKYLSEIKASFYKKLFVFVLSSIAFRSIISYRIIMTNAPLASTIIAPAGTGKTAGVVLPTILMCDNDSIIVNDPKGEIYDLTKDKRAKLGHVVYFKWEEPDCPFKWNPIELAFTTIDGVKQPKPTYLIAGLVNNMANILISSDSKDPFWTNSANSIFVNVAQYLIYKKWEETNTVATLADIKIFCESLGVAETEAEKEEEIKLSKKPNVDLPKEIRRFKLLNTVIPYLEEKANNDSKMLNTITILKGVFSALATKPESTFGSIMATLSTALKIFENENVVKNTSCNQNFDMADLRCGKDGKPMSVYLIVKATEQKVYGVISALFIEFFTMAMIDMGNPKKGDDSRMVRVILDEVAFFPSIDTVKEAPAITRSYLISYMFICQSVTQLKERYGENGYNDIITNSAFQIILSQNNPTTSRELSDSLGKGRKIIFTTRNKETTSREEEYNLFSSSKLGSLNGEQIVRVQNRADRPLLLNQPFWFMYPEFYNQMSSTKQTLKMKIGLNLLGFLSLIVLSPILLLVVLKHTVKQANKYYYK